MARRLSITGLGDNVQLDSLTVAWPSRAVETSIRYSVAQRGKIRLAIYNSLGQLVRVVVDTEVDPGVYLKSWDGRDASGRDQASGVYFSRLISDVGEARRPMVLLR